MSAGSYGPLSSTKADALEFTAIAYSGSSGNLRPTIDDTRMDNISESSHASLLPGGPSNTTTSTSLPIPFISQYTKYFDFDTIEITARLMRTLTPFAPQPLFGEDEKVDLYAPFWITTSLIVLLAAAGNLSSYLAFTPTETTPFWAYDFNTVSFLASLLYSWLSIAPVCLWFGLRRIASSERSLAELIALAGYSLLYFVPTAVLLVPAISWLRWSALAGCWVLSAVFLARNVWMHHEEMRQNTAAAPVVFAAIVAQALLVLAIRVQCFAL